MARTFSGGYASANIAVPTAYPFTMFVRAYSTSDSATQAPFTLMVSSGDAYNGSGLFVDGAFAGDPARFSKFGGVLANSGGSYSINTWHAVGGRAGSATTLDVSLDGVQTAGASTSVTFKTVFSLQIGAKADPTLRFPLAGACACAAVWDVQLDDAEFASLAKGFSPRRVRPQSLKLYVPMVRAFNIPFWSVAAATPSIGDTSGTSTPSDHPRSYGF